MTMRRTSRPLLCFLECFICCILLSTSLGCTSIHSDQEISPKDGGLFSGNGACKPPCFWGITPGISTESDVISIFQAKSVFSGCKTFDYESQGGIRGISCSIGPVITFQQGKDIVATIGIQPDQRFSVGEVINAYGKPSSVSVSLVGTMDEKQQTTMMLYFDQINTVLILENQDGYSFNVQPSTLIKNIGYNDDITYESMRNHSSLWTGYGKYQEKNQ
jgi:hypothetical protein